MGFRINCPESGETVITDMREIGPTYYFAPPRVLEALLTQVTIRMEDASWVKRAHVRATSWSSRGAWARASSTASRWARSTALLYALGDLLVYGAAAQRARHERACAWPTPRARRSAPISSSSTARSAST